MIVIPKLDVRILRAWMVRAVRDIAAVRADLDDVNVFPVPDADTGTNLYATLVEADRWLAQAPDRWGEALDATVGGAMSGARGNSGTILGAYLWGFASTDTADGLDGHALASAFRSAANAAVQAVAVPAPGTILTAARAAADAAEQVVHGSEAGVEAVAVAARDGAWAAAERSGTELPALARLGLRDAGAWGLAVLLDSLVMTVSPGALSPLPVMSVAAGTMGAMVPESMDGEFEVVFTVSADATAVDELRRELGDLGGSVVVGGGGSSTPAECRVHVHVDDPAAAVSLGERAAELSGGHISGVHVQAIGVVASIEIVACTSAPGLLADLARAGAITHLRADGWASDIVPFPTTNDVTLLPARPLLPGERDELTRTWGAHGASVEILATIADVHVVAVLAAGLAAGDEPRAIQAAMRRAVTDTTVSRGEAATLPAVPPGAVVIALADIDADLGTLTAWVRDSSATGVDIEILGSGRHGRQIELGVENPS